MYNMVFPIARATEIDVRSILLFTTLSPSNHSIKIRLMSDVITHKLTVLNIYKIL